MHYIVFHLTLLYIEKKLLKECLVSFYILLFSFYVIYKDVSRETSKL